jgi:hypothetical protein
MMAGRPRKLESTPPIRSDYMAGIEIVHHREGTATLIHSSIQELTPLHEFEAGSRVDLCKVKDITASTPYVNVIDTDGSITDTLRSSILLVRKKDSKIVQLLADKEPSEIDNESFFYGSVWSTPLPGLINCNGDTDAFAPLTLIVDDEPVEHCKGRGPPDLESGTANTNTLYRCPCGHTTEQKLQQLRLRGWRVDVQNENDSGDGLPLLSVEALLSVLEMPAAADLWV